ncbi:hypothetical protein [Mesorhizobium sp. M0019]|uniref:hypothetical protein n=1 Tax=Mesorhizobium sp. M0019 TaxID=2956845 RepID=UPI00333973FB
MTAFQTVLSNLAVLAVPTQDLNLSDGYVGAAISFDRLRFRTKNVPMEAIDIKGKWTQKFSGDLGKDPHIYANIGTFKLVIFIDANWITSSTAFMLFKPSSGQSVFSGLARVTNVDHEKGIVTATAWVIGLPKGPLDEMFEKYRLNSLANISSPSLDSLVDINKATVRRTYFSPPPEFCDLCRHSFDDKKYMVDGAVKGASGWACMCGDCFEARGHAVKWGSGQLYLRDEHGWLLVAGFPPSDGIQPLLD